MGTYAHVHEVDHSPPSSVQVKKEWSYTAIELDLHSPPCAFIAYMDTTSIRAG